MSGKKTKLERKQQHEGQLEKGGPSFASMQNGKLGPYKNMARILTQETETRITHSGPLPPPEMLKEYEKLIPGAPERLLALVEKEQENRHAIEACLTEGMVKDAGEARKADKRGDYIALFIFISCMGTGAVLWFHGSEVLAGTLMGAPLVTSIATFLSRRRQRTFPKNEAHNKEAG